MKDERFSTSDAARMLGVSRQTIYNWIHDGTVTPSSRWAGRPLWSRANLERIAARTGRTLGTGRE